ncbi:MAG: bleomycin hydrolase [Chlamydiales bacterium]|jgi:bleomycin hydrolase
MNCKLLKSLLFSSLFLGAFITVEASENYESISAEEIDSFHQSFQVDSKNRLAQRAVSKTGFQEVGIDLARYAAIKRVFSHEAKERGQVTNQKSSGRCWIFAGLNVMSEPLVKEHNLENFEFSQNYLFFWDKLEKANYFLNEIIATRSEPLENRNVEWLLQHPIPDGGFWHLFANLVKKYGVVPKSAMPETFNSSQSDEMGDFLASKLREYASVIRSKSERGESKEDLELAKKEMLGSVYKILAIYLGEPPKAFDWSYKDKDGVAFFYDDLTPQQFVAEHVSFKVEDKICILNAPQKSKPFGKNYVLKLSGNVVEGDQGAFLNLPIEKLTQYTRSAIEDGESVWFGCDVAKHLARKVEFDEEHFDVLDTQVLTHDLLFGTECRLDKGSSLDYRQGELTHAMAFTAVNIKNDQPDFWSVENSWGEKHACKGFLTMSQEWFEDHVYQVIIDKKYLDPEDLALIDEEAVMLEPWDSIG